jgi:hypothetical protein
MPLVYLKKHCSVTKESVSLTCILLAGIVNVFTTTPLWVVNTRLKMKGLGSRTGHGTADHVADQYSGLIGMTVAGDVA